MINRSCVPIQPFEWQVQLAHGIQQQRKLCRPVGTGITDAETNIMKNATRTNKAESQWWCQPALQVLEIMQQNAATNGSQRDIATAHGNMRLTQDGNAVPKSDATCVLPAATHHGRSACNKT